MQPKDGARNGVGEISDDVVVQKTDNGDAKISNEGGSKPEGADDKKDTELSAQVEIVSREDLKEIFQRFGIVKVVYKF